MGLLAKTIGDQRLEDYTHVGKVAKDLGLNPQTIKRWLKTGAVHGVVWGRDRRGWVFVHKESVKLLKSFRDSIRVS